MAGVGFFGRLRNLWRGFLGIWISDVEKKHPEVAYENAINSMVEKYTQLKKATAAIIARREDIDGRLAAKQKDLAQVTADLNTAVETNQQDLGMVLIQKQKQLSEDVAGLQADHEQALKDADAAKASLTQVQNEIKKLKAEKDNMLAKMASAEARVKIQAQLDGLTLDNESKALDNVREHIKNTIAQANLNQELGETDVDKRLAALRAKTGDVTAKSDWDKMVAARAAAQAGQKTM
jgi:phage shock protein A